jgi:glycosyltransferase involved in cell wall biosynthesis
MRYHDPLPVVAADTFDLDWAVNHHYYMTRRVAQDSHFVCNSQVTMDQLLRLAPHVEGRAHVVPYTLPDLSVWPYQDADLGRIIRQRATITSLDTAGRNEADRNAAKTQLAQAADAAESFDYVLMVSTIEPRKNFIGAIAAVNALRMRTGKDLKFIIVGRPGWAFAETMRAIAPEVIAGDVIHLVDVSFNELLNLYKKARALVFPSFGEGFGFTPMEALQCGTPAVVSDIPVHRWVMDDAVLYADPYDTGAIVDQLDRLLYSDNAESLRQELLSRGPAVLDRYSPSRTRDQWANLFDELSRAKR